MNFITYITPLNLQEEKEKYFQSRSYNPIFKYAWDKPENEIWAKNHSKYATLCHVLKSQDVKNIHKETSKLFETKITSPMLKRAKQIISSTPNPNAQTSMKTVVEQFEYAFTYFNLSDYAVEVVDQAGFNVRPSPKKKKIIISKYLNLEFFSIDGEVKHELTHIIRYENGKYNNIRPATNYLPTEEGLATYCQDYAGENGFSSLFQHASEYAGTQIAQKGSLRETIEYFQSNGFSKELAWQRAVRHKFGFIDTSQPGDIMKPSMYFYHQQLIKQLTNKQRYKLFVGKISKDQLSKIDSYTGIIPLNRLEMFYNFKKNL